MFQLHTASLHQAMRSTGYVKPFKAWCSTEIGWCSTAVIGAFRSSLLRWAVPEQRGSNMYHLLLFSPANGENASWGLSILICERNTMRKKTANVRTNTAAHKTCFNLLIILPLFCRYSLIWPSSSCQDTSWVTPWLADNDGGLAKAFQKYWIDPLRYILEAMNDQPWNKTDKQH